MFKKKSERILVIKTDSLASFVAAEPAFDRIRRMHAGAQISLLTNPALQRLAQASPYFDQVAALPPATEAQIRKAFLARLRAEKFSLVYDLAANTDAKRAFSALGAIKPKIRSVSGTLRRKDGPSADEIERLFSAGDDVEPPRKPDFSWALAARKDSANMRPGWFGVSGPFGLIFPSLDEKRRWSSAGYAALAKTMSQNNVMPILVGGRSLHSFGDEIAHNAPEIVDLTGKTDHLQLAALARDACFFVTDGADEADLAVTVGCRGVFLAGEKTPPTRLDPQSIVVLTAPVTTEIRAEFVWRTLNNMGLLTDVPGAQAVASR
ncbi:MAG: glycosyltransferase family 9 protein [Pseudomonadota bacterium]